MKLCAEEIYRLALNVGVNSVFGVTEETGSEDISSLISKGILTRKGGLDETTIACTELIRSYGQGMFYIAFQDRIISVGENGLCTSLIFSHKPEKEDVIEYEFVIVDIITVITSIMEHPIMKNDLERINGITSEMEDSTLFIEFHNRGEEFISSLAVRSESNKLYEMTLDETSREYNKEVSPFIWFMEQIPIDLMKLFEEVNHEYA